MSRCWLAEAEAPAARWPLPLEKAPFDGPLAGHSGVCVEGATPAPGQSGAFSLGDGSERDGAPDGAQAGGWTALLGGARGAGLPAALAALAGEAACIGAAS